MPSSEPAIHRSARVQRATRLNVLEQARLQQRLMLLDKDRLRQERLTNQDIRTTSAALDYVVNCSGHSPEGRDPDGQPVVDISQPEEKFFFYGERVTSRKIHRMPRRPHSAVERPSFHHGMDSPEDQSASSEADASSISAPRSRLSQRPYSSPARGRTWKRCDVGEERRGSISCADNLCEKQQQSHNSSISESNSPSSNEHFNRAMLILARKVRLVPHQSWEDDTHEITKKILKAQQVRSREHSGPSRLYLSYNDRHLPPTVKGFVRSTSGTSSSAIVSFPYPRIAVPVEPVLPVRQRSKSAPLHRKSAGSSRSQTNHQGKHTPPVRTELRVTRSSSSNNNSSSSSK